MKKKYLVLAIIPVIALVILGTNIASAHGWFGFQGLGMMASSATPDQIAQNQQTQFQNIATLLGINVDKVKDGWAQGKTISQIAQNNGITGDQLKQKMTDAKNQQLKDYLKTLVDKGVITQAQADQRLQFMQQHTQKGKMGKGWGFGKMMRF